MELHLIISGRVQGVGYRQWLCGRALAAGVTGWVRNRADGTVEAVLCGPAESVEALVAAAMAGPPGARVDDIRRREAEAAQVDQAGKAFFIASSAS
ncbi:acylphosphatase [Bosea caraganae]|uniref:acylphosphatase n=1 Tax=Bosea caraganae TaxID=2763117 RepID=A0A370L7F6_9HYPH|nr:acylphosphatase [Bosea caraganae]RDJ23154.1 acylphosphatase [Bosea caraganae]RDJ24733.1 acylphosphatase [Bosea caraganae]